MTPALDAARLRRERLQRRWSQEHLASVSGISVRTIQRLERGEAVALETQSALAAMFDLFVVPTEASVGPTLHLDLALLVRRVTPLTILPEIGSALQAYLDLGFAKVVTDHPGCVGLKAGHTHLILVTAEFMADDFREQFIAPLVGQTIPYIFVRSLELAVAKLSSSAAVIEQVSTRGGTHEALVEQVGRYQILAEKLGTAAAP
jgi:transcriptional regulator with XRE-family HTH domain